MSGSEWFYEFSRRIFELSSSVWGRSFEIIIQPSIYKEMLWILLPLLATLFVMQIYFSRYKREELGWNSALGNSIVLLFVGAGLVVYIIKNNLFYFFNRTGISFIKTSIVLLVVLESILLVVTNFLHSTPKIVAYRLSSVLFLNFIAIISVILVYSNVPLDYITLVSSVLIFFVLCLFFEVLHILIPEHLFGEFNEIKESMREVEARLKEVEIEKKEAEEDRIHRRKKELDKEKEKIKKLEKEIDKTKK